MSPNKKKPTPPVPVYDYRTNKNGARLPNNEIKGVKKCAVDYKGGCDTVKRTPFIGNKKGLHGGVMINENGKGKIIYH